MMLQTYIIVLGYGCRPEGAYREYLSEVAVYAARNRRAALIISGGRSDLSVQKTEAQVIWDTLNNVTTVRLTNVTIRDDSALSTDEKIAFAAQQIKARMVADSEVSVTVFCDDARLWKVKYLVWKHGITGHITYIPHILTSGSLERLFQRFVATPLDILASEFNVFKKMKTARKNRIIENKLKSQQQ